MRSNVVGSNNVSTVERGGTYDSTHNTNYNATVPLKMPGVASKAPVAPTFKSPNIHTTHDESPHAQAEPETADGWFVLLILAVAVYSVTVSIIDANWVSHSMVLLASPLVGLLLGVFVAKVPRIPQSILHLTACLLGHWLAVLLTSVFAFHVSWLAVLVSLRAVITGGLGDIGIPNGQEMIFFFYLCFLCFFLGYFGSWLVYRARLPWLVAFVYTSIMLVNLNYVRQNLLPVFIVLLCSLLLLIARVHLTSQVMQWKRDGLRTDGAWLRAISGRCMQVASLLTLIVLVLSPILPMVTQPQSGVVFWNDVTNAWNNVLGGHVSLQNPGSIIQDYQPPADFFGNQLMITGSVRLPTGQVLTYTSSNGPQYLEGFTYNQFDGHTWTSSIDGDNGANTQMATANQQLQQDVAGINYTQVNTTVTLTHPPQETKNYIFGPAQPLMFDVATVIYGDGTASAWTQASPLVTSEQYHVVSAVAPTDPKQYANIPLPLGSRGAFWENDPNFAQVSASYLHIPGDLSPRVEQTLQSWTGNSGDAYDALKSIEAHLSDTTNFTYSVDNTPVPVNVDAVDWILQTHKGYCTYYATAMSIMGRMLGIPTRIVSGFSQGHYDRQHKVWIVNGNDAHSWVQAYLPNFGWISFDPTPGFAPTQLKSNPTTPPTATKAPVHPVPTTPPASKKPVTPPKSTTSNKGLLDSPRNATLLMAFSMTTLLLSLLFLLVAIGSYWWRTLFANSPFVTGMFWRLCYVARFIGIAPRKWQTPYEYSQELSKYVPEQAGLVFHLTHLFVRERYGPPHQAPHPQEIEAAQKLWPGYWHIFGQMLLQRFRRRM